LLQQYAGAIFKLGERLRKELSDSEVCSEVLLIIKHTHHLFLFRKQSAGFLLVVSEELQGKLEKIGEDGFFMTFESFYALRTALEDMFSPSATIVILSSTGDKCGRQSCRDIRKKIKAKENVLAYLSHLKESMNWGKILFQDVDFQMGTGKITVRDSFEIPAHKYHQPQCHFLRGFFAGFLSELFDKEICVAEVKCAGMGGSHCQFEFE